MKRMSGSEIKSLFDSKRYGNEVTTSSQVYFIEAVTPGMDRGPIKIGHAKDPRGRLKDLQVGCPFELKLLATMDGGERAEKELQAHFSEHQMRGEWFSADSAILSYIARCGLTTNKTLLYHRCTAIDQLPDNLREILLQADTLSRWMGVCLVEPKIRDLYNACLGLWPPEKGFCNYICWYGWMPCDQVPDWNGVKGELSSLVGLASGNVPLPLRNARSYDLVYDVLAASLPPCNHASHGPDCYGD